MSDFIAKTFREQPAQGLVITPPRQAEIVGRIYSAALMGPTNLKSPVVLELWSNGTMTWRDG